MVNQFVPVSLDLLEVHQLADQNVSLTPNAHKIKPVQIKNVAILVRELVELELNAMWLTIIQFVVVRHDIRAIHLQDVNQSVRFLYIKLREYFLTLYFLVETPPQRDPINPCIPSPCGPNSECRTKGEQPVCSCLKDFTGVPPNCRPECISNSECASNLACISQKCRDPCPGSCGLNAECRVVSHTPMCVCNTGYTGDPFSQCQPQQSPIYELSAPCTPNPCGANAICREQNSAGSCQCMTDYIGNPYEGCRPECVLNSDCPSNRACLKNKCQDPCPGTCGTNAECQVVNHLPSCTCFIGYTGDPYRYCNVQPKERKLINYYLVSTTCIALSFNNISTLLKLNLKYIT